MSIREWLVLYVKHKDLLKRSLVSVDDGATPIVFHFKDGDVAGFAADTLELPPGVCGKAIIACLHTPENVDELVRRWKEFAAHKDLTIIFANIARNEKVVIHTRTHDSVADGKIETGIRALADGVPYV